MIGHLTGEITGRWEPTEHGAHIAGPPPTRTRAEIEAVLAKCEAIEKERKTKGVMKYVSAKVWPDMQ